MLIIRKQKGCYSKIKYIQGRGFVDVLQSSVLPALKGIGSYVVQNKDLLAKPLLGAVGELGAMALTEGGRALLTRLMKKDRDQTEVVTGSGIKHF